MIDDQRLTTGCHVSRTSAGTRQHLCHLFAEHTSKRTGRGPGAEGGVCQAHKLGEAHHVQGLGEHPVRAAVQQLQHVELLPVARHAQHTAGVAKGADGAGGGGAVHARHLHVGEEGRER
jgi:hypothetical protein